MPIVRPLWQGDLQNTSNLSVPSGGAPAILFEITGGPGLIKGGGIQISAIGLAVADYNLQLFVDTVSQWDFPMDVLDTISANGSTLPWTFAEATTTADFDFKENANLGFLTSVKLEIRKNTGGSDNVDVIGGIDYHLGA